ncbi:hypothetical protein B0F90DRAFT_1649724, partial [Multifurca ochricompacta]
MSALHHSHSITPFGTSNFALIFRVASKEYKKQTGQDLDSHPFATALNNCHSPDAVLNLFREQAQAFDEFRKEDESLMKWLRPTIHILYMFSATLGEGISLPFSPAKVIFTGIGVLLVAAKDVSASHDVLANLFERIQGFLARLEIYSGIPLTTEMADLLGKIMAEVLSILALSTREMNQRRIKKYLKKLVGKTEIEDSLQRLDQLTQEEVRAVVAKNLQVTHNALNFVEELVKSGHSNLHICITSRPEQDIRTILEPLTSFRFSLHDESGQKEDIINYIRSFVRLDRAMRRWRAEDKELFLMMLCRFRWVFCQLDTLRRCIPASIRRALDELPVTLDETYERTLVGIPEEKWEHAHRLFQCLIASVRPLRVDELAEVFAIQFDQGTSCKLLSGWRPDDAEDAVLSACSSLIAIISVGGLRVVQFSHFSVKEFLTSNRLATASVRIASRYHVPLESAHEVLARVCLLILLQLPVDDQVDRDHAKDFPLALYAAQHWVDH